MSYPTDGGIAADDAVGQRLLQRVRHLDAAREAAAKKQVKGSHDFEAFVNTLRAEQGDRKVVVGDLHLVSCRKSSGSDVSSRPAKLTTSFNSHSRPCTPRYRNGRYRTETPTWRSPRARWSVTMSPSDVGDLLVIFQRHDALPRPLSR